MRHLLRVYRLVMVLVFAHALTACGWAGRKAEPGVSSPETQLANRAADPSIYGLDLALTGEDGRTRALADLRGRVLVAAMMYTSCTSVCPRVVDDMRGIERQLSVRDHQAIEFVLFSLDAGRDTPMALRQFAMEHGVAASNWRLFAASADGVRELSAVLGVKYKAQEDGEIGHSAMIFVIDREGVVRHRQIGINQDLHGLTAALALIRR